MALHKTTVGEAVLIRWLAVLWCLLVLGLTYPAPAAETDAPQDGPQTSHSQDELRKKEPESEKGEDPKAEALKSLQVHGDYTFIPLPAFAYSRNEGYWIGALMPILKANDKGELEHILAPQYLHNRYIGETVSLNYFGYPSDNEQYSAVASYSTKIQRDIDLAYKNVATHRRYQCK